MKSNVVYKNNTEKSRTYPYLGIFKNTNVIVLFTRPNEGVVVHSYKIPSQERNDLFQFGYFSRVWFEHLFDIFDGTVELSN